MKSNIAILAALSLTLGIANAQQAPSGFYVGAEVGQSKLKDQTSELSSALNSGFSGGSSTVSQSSSVTVSRFFGGYNINENVAVELGYSQSSSFGLNGSGKTGNAFTQAPNIAYSFSGGEKFSGFDISGLFRPSVDTGWNGLFFRAGVTNLKESNSVTVSVTGVGTPYSNSGSQSGTGTVYGIGYDADIGSGFKVRAAVTSYSKIAGDSSASGTLYSIGILKNF